MAETPDDTMALAEALLNEPAHVRFLRSLEEAKAKSQTMIDVEGTPFEQVVGQPALAFTCPICKHAAALSGEGRHQCRYCHTWLRIHQAE
jgi:hypothetical protein